MMENFSTGLQGNGVGLANLCAKSEVADGEFVLSRDEICDIIHYLSVE